MNCDCIDRIEGKMVKFMTPQAGTNVTARIQGVAFALGETLTTKLMIPFRIKGTAKGFTSEKGKEMGCAASNCPFCGRTTGRYVVGEDAGIAAAFAAAELAP